MNAFYFVVDELLADIAGAQALHLSRLWPGCDIHLFVERRDPTRAIREVRAPSMYYHYERLSGFLAPRLPGSQKWPNIVFLRLFAPTLLGGYERLIYLDADIHGLRSDPSIWDVPLPSGLGAVSDIATLHRVPPDLRQSRADWLASIGVASGRYANSGFLLIDPRLWRAQKIAAALPAYFQEYPAAARFDQDFLNHHFDGRWTEIGPRFNYQARLFGLGCSEAVEPVFVHFCQAEKPWFGEPGGWRSCADARYTRIYTEILTTAGFDPDDYRRPFRPKPLRRMRWAVKGWLSRNGLVTWRERRDVAKWRQRSEEFRSYLTSGLADGRFADESRRSVALPELAPVFDGRFVTAQVR